MASQMTTDNHKPVSLRTKTHEEQPLTTIIAVTVLLGAALITAEAAADQPNIVVR
jgi:hypothetical protein